METLHSIFFAVTHFFRTFFDLGLQLADSYLVLPLLYAFCTIDGALPIFPSETLMIALGSLAASGRAVSIWLVFLFGWAGAVSGDLIAYHMGRHLPIYRFPGLRGENGAKRISAATRALRKRGTMFILSARFVPIGRIAVNLTAGATHFGYRRFVPTVIVAGAVWSGFSCSMGFFAGSLFQHEPILAVVIGVAAGIVVAKIVDLVMQRFVAWWYGPDSDSDSDVDDEAATGAN